MKQRPEIALRTRGKADWKGVISLRESDQSGTILIHKSMVHSMNSKKILTAFSELQSELLKNGPTARFHAEKRIMTTVIRIYRSQLSYEKLKEKSPDLHFNFFEPFVPISAKDRANLDKAVAINRQIGKTLADLKKVRAAPNADAGG